MIAGAMSYENLYLVDGVSVKEMVLGQPRPFPIEDALEETSTAVTGISAEYGRFTGGVVNAITRSGGNEFSGSFRVTLQDEAWRSLTPYERENLADDPREGSVVPTYEGTFGGPILRDRLWYFLAGRWQETTSAETLAYTNLPYRNQARETRFEAKLTWSPLAGQNLRIAYGEIDTREENVVTAPAMDYASLNSRTIPEDLLSIHANSMASRNVFLEAQYSHRGRVPTGLGARTTDLVGGTVLRDGSRDGAQWNSPRFCAVCGVPPGELRKAEEAERGLVAKASGLFSGPRAGAHHLVVGGEIADELRKSNSFQSGSGYTVTASRALFGEDGAIYPVFLPGRSTVIEWNPIFELSKGGRFRTTSAFLNDSWRLGDRWSFNLGLRWDATDSRDQSGVKVSGGHAWSPRLAVAFDPRGDGAWTFDAGFARYVASLNFSIGDIGTSAGRPARFVYTYEGPAVNGPGSSLVSTEEALSSLFGWFFANGGTSRPLRQAPGIPGLNRRAGGDLVPPRSDETTLGVTRRIGKLGSVRLAGMRRVFTDQYVERADTLTGKVTDPASGQPYDLRLIENSDRVKRTYGALLLQVDLRIRPDLRVAASYTLSETRGNFDGDDASDLGGSTPENDLSFFPEYGEERWRAPSGPLKSDQRHRARLWAMYDLPLAGRWGRLSIAALERIDSGQAWSAVGEIDSHEYVANPGYINPPTRVPYFFEARGQRRTETVIATDLSINYAVSPPVFRQAELFARIVVVNLFDQSAQTRPGNTTVFTAANDPRYVAFDPFVQEPVRGVHWDFAPGFGSALSADDFALPRTLILAFGLRF